MSFAAHRSAGSECLLQGHPADRGPIRAAGRRSRHRQAACPQAAVLSSRSRSDGSCEAATCDGLRIIREGRQATALRTTCRATESPAEFEEATELDEQDDQSGAGYDVPDELLRLIAPSTVPTPIFDSEEVWALLEETVHDKARQHYRSFFSSVVGGIITDPALMSVHIDDHMVHRGHGVFDTAKLIDGHLYELEAHMERFLVSAGKAGITAPISIDQMARTILETAAASSAANGHVRFWLSAGRGGFGLSTSECDYASFYVMVYTDDGERHDLSKGWKVKTSPVPQKPVYFATLKSTNYLVNALNLLDAEVEDYDQGVFVDPDGNVAEGPNMNLAILTQDNIIVTPVYEYALPGITMSRLIELVEPNMEKGLLEGVEGVDQRPISLEEAKSAKEVFFTSSSLPVMPVVSWDGEPIGTGEVGPVVVKLHAMMDRDATPSDGTGAHTPVPYGFVTRMDAPEDDDE